MKQVRTHKLSAILYISNTPVRDRKIINYKMNKGEKNEKKRQKKE